MRPASCFALLVVCVLLALPLCCIGAPKTVAAPRNFEAPRKVAAAKTPPPPETVLKCPPLPAFVLEEKRLAKPLEKGRLRSALPRKIDYSEYITLTRCQDGFGGCFIYAALSVIDIIKEREHPYTPDLSYRYAQYYYDTKKIDQKKIHTDYGSCSEAKLHSDYDGLVWVQDHYDESNCPVPSNANDAEARRYRIKDASEPITPTVAAVKSLLVDKGPLWASGTISTVGHCVAVVGYDDDREAVKFLNSWGDNWGEASYGWIPYDELSQTLDVVRWYTNEPSERAGHPDAYTARIRVRHELLRSELTVKVGAGNRPPLVVWDRPNHAGPMLDSSRNLSIDVPLPSYASSHWPPNPRDVWYVEVTDATKDGKIATVEEVTLAKLVKKPDGTYFTEVHRPNRSEFTIPDGGSKRVLVGAQPPSTVLTLEADPQVVKPGGTTTLRGNLSVRFYDSSGPTTIVPSPDKEIKINRVTPAADSVEQSNWELVSTAKTDAAGNFSLKATQDKATTYLAVYTKSDGEIVARSKDCRVAVGKAVVPTRQRPRPILR